MSDLDGGELIAAQLARAGVDTVFGVLAGPMHYAFKALPAAGITVVSCRHEEQAGFMAQAWGYVRRQPGVVITGSGPGMTNVVTSMHVAQENGWPLVVLGGSVAGAERGLGGFQEADQRAFAAPAVKWSVQADRTERIPELVHLALGKAVSGRPGAVYVDFPADLLWTRAPSGLLERTARPPRVHPPAPDVDGIATLARWLAEAERPLMIIGKGAAWDDAGDPLRRLADLGIPFVADPMGRGTVPDDHPRSAAAARNHALRSADVVLMVGGRFDWMYTAYHRGREEGPRPRIGQIDVAPEAFFSAANVDLGLVASPRTGAAALVDALAGRPLAAASSGWLQEISDRVARKESEVRERMGDDRVPITHHRLWREVRDFVDRDAIVVTDGEVTPGVGRVVMPSYAPRSRLDAGTTSCMGVGVPYAIGAKLACPDRQVVAVLGDYAFGASAMEVETAARVGAAVTFVVDNNAGIGGHHFQRGWFGADGPPVASLLPARYDLLATMVDGHGEHVAEPRSLRAALERAREAQRVAVVNVATDPLEHGLNRGSEWLTTGYYVSTVPGATRQES